MSQSFDQLSSFFWIQLWQVTMVAALVYVFVRLVCRRRPHLAYLMWMLVIAKCLTPPIVASPTSIFSWVQSSRDVLAESDTAFVPNASDNVEQEPIGAIDARDGILNEERPVAPIAPVERPTSDAAGGAPTSQAAALPRRPTRTINLAECLIGLWCGGVSIALCMTLVRAWKCHLQLGQSSLEQHELASLVSSVAAELSIKSQVRVVVTRHSFGPAVFGLFSPTIILPMSVVRRCSNDQLRTIIGHELVHFRRRDTWMGVVQLCTQIVWWFHPCVWFANRQATLERERCCDAEVLAHLQCDPAVYAQSLLDVLKQKQSLHGLFALPGMKPVEITRRRLSAILDANVRPAGRTPGWNWVVASLACLVIMPGAGLTLTAVESADSPAAPTADAIAKPARGSWPQGGGTSHRNQVTTERAATNWDVKSGENVRWKVKIDGSSALSWFGNFANASPIVSGGRVLITANNQAGLVKRLPAKLDLGCLICLDEETGKFLWQHSNPRLPTGRVHDWPFRPIASAPYVDGDRLWYVNNRAEIVCLDLEGFQDGDNDGPYKQEEVAALDEADVIWKYDMMKELGASPHNQCSCSTAVAGDLLLIVVPNGVGESHLEMVSPKAPSFIAVHKTTGKLVWQNDSATANTLHAGWGSAAYGRLGDVPQAIFPGGDGWLYSFDTRQMAQGKTKLLWKFDCNPKASEWKLGGGSTRNNLIAAPVIHDGLVYITTGQDPEHGEGDGVLWCLNPTARGDISAELVVRKDNPSQVVPARRGKAVAENAGEMVIPNPNEGVVWKFDKVDVNGNGEYELEETMHRSVSSVAIKDGLLVTTDMSGLVHCLDAKTGVHHWTYDAFAHVTATPLIAASHIYVPDEDGEVAIFKLDKTLQLVAVIGMETPIVSPLIAVGGTLYIQSSGGLAAISDEKKQAAIRRRVPPTSSNWPSFRGSGDNTGVAKDGLPSDLPLKWKVQIGSAVYGTPIIADGRVFIGDGQGTLYAFDEATGKLIWNQKNQGASFATPAFIQPLVCVGDEAGMFYAFDAATGKQKWAIDLGAAVSVGANVLGNCAYVASAAGSVFCVDVTAGEVLWKAECGDQIRSTPTILGDHVIVSGCDAKLHILDLKTGKTIKTKELGAPTMSTPAGSDSSLILGTQEGVMSLNLNDGDKPLWKFVTPRGNAEFRGSPAVTESTVYIGGGNRSVYALNRSTGEVLWQTAVKGRVDASPIVVGDMILIGSHDGRLYLMNRATGDVAWSYDTGGNIRSSTAVANRHAVIANERGVVYCFGE